MGLSSVLDKKHKNSKSTKVEKMNCSRLVKDCSYMDKDGKCSAEWCIYSELPAFISENKEIKCIICGKPKDVSIYNNEAYYICDDCKEDIDKVFKNPTCGICGAKTNAGQSICENCAIRLKELLNE